MNCIEFDRHQIKRLDVIRETCMRDAAVLGGNTQVVQLKIAEIEIVENGFGWVESMDLWIVDHV